MNAITELGRLLPTAAAQHGDRAAVSDASTSLTYRQLADTAQRLAANLREHGIGRGDCVVWHGAKNVWAIAAVHAILLAESAYVPLDPDGPIERAALIVAHGHPAAILADQAARDQWSRIDPTLEWQALRNNGAATDLHLAIRSNAQRCTPTDAAYVLHTSGSTGRPKGVVHTHSTALAFITWATAALDVTNTDVVAGTAPLHFDLSTFDLFATCLAGAELALITGQDAAFPASYTNRLHQQQATVWYTVPSTLAWLTRNGTDLLTDLASLRLAAFAGEVLPPERVNMLTHAVPGIRVLNLYGPTETNVCTYHELDTSIDLQSAIPIGRPLPDTEVLIVDGDCEPLPAGAEGQLLVTGSTVMSEYWADPQATELAFKHTSDGRRWYATGDQVRLRADHALDFLGRTDSQVKSRGYRIELGEIEAALRGLPAVTDSAAIAVPDPVFGTKIAAFVLTTETTDADHWTGLLRRKLPTYMLPERTVALRDFPRLSSGKLDRQALQLQAQHALSTT